MRFLLLVCTAALLLSGNVAEDDPLKRDEPQLEDQKSPKAEDPETAKSTPKEDEADDAKSPPKEDEADDAKSPPKEDESEVIRFPFEYGSKGKRVAMYWKIRGNQTEQSIDRMDKRLAEMRKNYALSMEKNKTLAAKMEAFNKKLYDVTMDLRRAQQQAENCKDVDTGNPLIPQWNMNNSRIGPVYTFRYIRLLRYLRANIDRELKAVTNLKWSREKRK
ncbi:uncharacterized protein LOC117189146 [Drosophila miranda]|nr:uncharacterized protein LOC117189146 [Drosophila miranda]